MSRAFARALRRMGIRHSRARPYRPQTSGKVERWIRTALSEYLYLEVFADGGQRRLDNRTGTRTSRICCGFPNPSSRTPPA